MNSNHVEIERKALYENNVQVHFLGVRGSAPSTEPIYGGGTSCVLVRIAGEIYDVYTFMAS